MARSPFEHRCRRAAALGVLVLGWAGLFPSVGAERTGFLVIEKARNAQYTREGILTADDVLLTHEGDIRITADHARHTPQADGTRKLELTGQVHIEVRGALLDADSAVLQFRDQDLLTVAVKGSQAMFSHQPEGYARRINGRADAIDFDAASGEVTFAGNTSYTDGRNSLASDLIVYGIEDGATRDDGDPNTRGRAIIKLGDALDRVPPPRQPNRSTAQ